MSLADAKALCGVLVCIEHDPAGDQRALEALGRWLIRFTPIVARATEDEESSLPGLFLDLTGCELLFRGIPRLVGLIRQSLERFTIPAQLAVATTPGAAWALAITGGPVPKIVDAASLVSAVSPLPITSLRLDEVVMEDLILLGLQQVGHVLALPREELPSRFGPSLLKRLDQLTGAVHEPLVKLVTEAPITARMDLDAPIESPETIQFIFEKLLSLVLSDLIRRNHGVRQLRMTCKPDPGWDRPMVTRTIALSRPHRHQRTLSDLIRCEIERIDCDHGFVRFQLDVPAHEPISESQTQLFEQQSTDEQFELERLFQRLRSRLGDATVIRPELVESYLPERAWRPATDDAPAVAVIPLPPRPLYLLKMPVEIRVICEPCDDRTGEPRQFSWQSNVYRLRHITGPERIAGEWWRGHHRTRDYYDVEDEIGRRFWIFRVARLLKERIIFRWFLHGRFD
jgi:protein ImuB